MDDIFIIEKPSGVHSGNCILGQGATEDAAWADAYGPKPWTEYQKKSAKGAWAKSVTPEELEQLQSQ